MKLTKTMRDAFIRAALDDVPSIDYRQQAIDVRKKDALNRLPAKVRALVKDNDIALFIVTSYCHGFGGGFALIGHQEKPLPDAQEKIDALEYLHNAQVQKVSDLKSQLTGLAYSVSTRKALADAAPEFEKYLPEDEAKAIRTLPVVQNVVANMVAAGWPKSAKKKPLAAK